MTELSEAQRAYLNDVREVGYINMFEAWKPLMAAYDLSKDDAVKILVEWMETFKEEEE